MASTKYELLCRYYNKDMKMSITNLTKNEWVSSFEDISKVNAIGVELSEEVFEFYTKDDPIQERKIQDALIYGNSSANPKFDMFFMYKARDFHYSDSITTSYPYVLTDRMERVPLSPWFVHSVHGSLVSVMKKGKILANIIGHDNVKIGKVVDLDKFIEIV